MDDSVTEIYIYNIYIYAWLRGVTNLPLVEAGMPVTSDQFGCKLTQVCWYVVDRMDLRCSMYKVYTHFLFVVTSHSEYHKQQHVCVITHTYWQCKIMWVHTHMTVVYTHWHGTLGHWCLAPLPRSSTVQSPSLSLPLNPWWCEWGWYHWPCPCCGQPRRRYNKSSCHSWYHTSFW